VGGQKERLPPGEPRFNPLSKRKDRAGFAEGKSRKISIAKIGDSSRNQNRAVIIYKQGGPPPLLDALAK